MPKQTKPPSPSNQNRPADPSTHGKPSQTEQLSKLPWLPKDHPLFSHGWVIGFTPVGRSSSDDNDKRSGAEGRGQVPHGRSKKEVEFPADMESEEFDRAVRKALEDKLRRNILKVKPGGKTA